MFSEIFFEIFVDVDTVFVSFSFEITFMFSFFCETFSVFPEESIDFTGEVDEILEIACEISFFLFSNENTFGCSFSCSFCEIVLIFSVFRLSF